MGQGKALRKAKQRNNLPKEKGGEGQEGDRRREKGKKDAKIFGLNLISN